MVASNNPGRRNSMRVPCGLRVQVMAEPEPFTAEVMNISQKGLFLRANVKSPRDALRLSTSLGNEAPVVVAFKFAGEDKEVRATCHVAWKSDLGVGIEFSEPPERLRDFISDLIDAENTAYLLSQVESGRVEFPKR
jgi:hypothetical protein